MKTFFLATITLLFVIFSSSAFADCNSVGDDAWNTTSKLMAEAFEAGDYNQALSYARTLEMTCEKSPIVNHITSEIYSHLGDEKKSLQYIERAIENTYEFEVPPALLRRMWDKRIMLESHSAIEDSAKYIALEQRTVVLEEENARLKAGPAFDVVTNDVWTDLMWSGTGIAIGGVVLATVGGILTGLNYASADKNLATFRKDVDPTPDNNEVNGVPKDVHDKAGNDFNKHNQKLQIGMAFIGAGAGLAVTGTILAILGAVNKKTDPEAVETSFYIQPTGAGLSIKF